MKSQQLYRLGLLVLGSLLLIQAVSAQRPGGGGLPGGDAPRPTLPANQAPTLPQGGARPTLHPGMLPTLTLPSPGMLGTPQPGAMPVFATLTPIAPLLTVDFSSLTPPAGTTMSAEQLAAALAASDAPNTLDLSSLTLPPTSATAYAAVNGFAQQYLGWNFVPAYAAEFSTAQGSARPRVQQAQGSAELAAILAQFPPEVQALLANAEGIAYAGLATTALGVVYTGECTAAQCSIPLDNLQFQITQSSLGAYGIYVNTVIADETAAVNLFSSLFPGLPTLYRQSVEQGYAYARVMLEPNTGVSVGYYVGVVPIEAYALVYAIVGVGEGYATLMR